MKKNQQDNLSRKLMAVSSKRLAKLSISKQKGTVLITVLLVVAFVVILVAEVNKTVTYQANLNRNLMFRDQAYSYLTGMEELAKIYLQKAFEAEDDDIVHLGQPWAEQDITFPIEGGGMTAKIIDMQSCFNINSISLLDSDTNQRAPNNPGTGTPQKSPQGNTGARQSPDDLNKETTGEIIFTTLLEKVLDDTEIRPSSLASELRDWIDADSTPSGPDGVEDLYYQGLDIPYLPPNGPIAHTSELRTIKSFTNATYQKIKPYICVLPKAEDYKINVNTITVDTSELLYAALGGKISQADVDKIISERPESGYTIDDFWAKIGAASTVKKSLKERIDITSKYFLMDAKAEVGKTRVYMKTLFEKQSDNNFKVVSRYFGKE